MRKTKQNKTKQKKKKLQENYNLNTIWRRKINCVLLHSRGEIKFWTFYSKWLTPTLPAFLQHKMWLSNKHIAYGLVSFSFVQCNEPKFWQLTLIFSAFYRLYLEITLLHITPSGQIISCHAWRRQNVSIFWLILSRHYWTLKVSPSFRNSI